MIVKNLQYNIPIVELQKKYTNKFISFIQMIDQVIHDKAFENKLVIEEGDFKSEIVRWTVISHQSL